MLVRCELEHVALVLVELGHAARVGEESSVSPVVEEDEDDRLSC